MNQKSNKSKTMAPAPCVCQGAGPVLSDVLRRLGPPKEARRHFDTARLEFLKGIRALLDARIEKFSAPNKKGEKIAVE